ncbi:nitrite reductase heme biosynthesis G [Dinoroseobacter shibae DFL 12 = DSM 16493]|jgi:DNA-binding Lrp family transcriptional regulator|uniref:Siroheme decarboxylase NirG subunit n=1 Tax=Dinoroseobacter shibae (strain DSM 16493 / NCIMB 14021 / DFL 12) TaxID=398580 RepID=A8LLZ9_DINSH|nr:MULTISPECIES: AsnC family transcriptional regulator [Dinoroseobacter]ABV94908.1 nitrite reductase heme biosynthesis G [Dinoroseobacter shibae DFL 12 = DSM 16493]MDD9717956.1 AsnC family transcriptional regulator [Dinoroseobacter sp. PD6]URF46329.1 Lrp/AsnC family transcriptional regulator [Dinoroseobacter shibae]URF50635.1 Lrp/AsnC family transcriptional regulator [Dinoroseobacter shibae]
MTLDATDRLLLNELQAGFPIAASPFAVVGDALGLTEDDVIARIARMREAGYVTRFGPFYDAAAMGGGLCLCAMEVPADAFDAVLTKVNALPEVAHNYERTHRLNMWFVLATETEDGITEAQARIEAETGLPVLLFPKLQEFFIGFRVAA